MNARSFLLGIAAGFSAGYAAYRTAEAFLHSGAGPARRNAARYGSLRRALGISGIARSLAGTAVIAHSSLGEALENNARFAPVWLRAPLFAAQAAVLDAILDAGVDYVEEFILERRFDLSDQTFSSWASDKIKEEVLGAGITIVLTGIFAGAVRRFPWTWPAIASLGTLPLLVAANIVIPIYIMPMFNRYEAIEGPLEQRLRALASRYGAGGAEILRMNMSKQTKKANAFVTGIGHTHRIVVGDTLIDNFPIDEIEFVVAHELGHYVARDSWRMIAVGQAATMVVLFGAFAFLPDRSKATVDRPVTLARIAWWSSLLTQALRPAIGFFSRSREWAADRFALETTATPLAGASAFRRLRDQNLAEDEQPAWYEFLFSTHPSLKARIAALERAASD